VGEAKRNPPPEKKPIPAKAGIQQASSFRKELALSEAEGEIERDLDIT